MLLLSLAEHLIETYLPCYLLQKYVAQEQVQSAISFVRIIMKKLLNENMIWDAGWWMLIYFDNFWYGLVNLPGVVVGVVVDTGEGVVVVAKIIYKHY